MTRRMNGMDAVQTLGASLITLMKKKLYFSSDMDLELE